MTGSATFEHTWFMVFKVLSSCYITNRISNSHYALFLRFVRVILVARKSRTPEMREA